MQPPTHTQDLLLVLWLTKPATVNGGSFGALPLGCCLNFSASWAKRWFSKLRRSVSSSCTASARLPPACRSLAGCSMTELISDQRCLSPLFFSRTPECHPGKTPA